MTDYVDVLRKPGTRDEICDAWPGNVYYNGVCIFEVVYDDEELIKDMFAERLPSDFQECYLGYVADEDFFIMGFDTWPDSGEKRNNIFRFEMTDTGRVRNVKALGSLGRMFYSDKNLSALHKAYPSLVDIRLD